MKKFLTILITVTAVWGITNESWAAAGCTIIPLTGNYPNKLECYDDNGNNIYSMNYKSLLTYDETTSTYTSASGSELTFDVANKTITEKPISSGSNPYFISVSTYKYDDNWNITSSSKKNKNSDGQTTSSSTSNYTYDTKGNKTSYTHEDRDGSGQLTYSSNFTYSNGKTTSGSSTDYDSNGNVKNTVYAYSSNGSQTGSTTTYADATGNPFTGTWVSGGNTYNVKNGTMTDYYHKSTDDNGNIVTHHYNQNNEFTGMSYTDSSGNALTGPYKDGAWTYNISDGNVTDYRYDYSGSCYRSNPDGSCQAGGYTNLYNATGNKTGEVYTDLNGNQKIYDIKTGEYTYLDAEGNALTGTYISGTDSYYIDDGELFGRMNNSCYLSGNYYNCTMTLYNCEKNSCHSVSDPIRGKGTFDAATGKQFLCISSTNCYIIGDGFVQGIMTCETGGTNCTTEFYDIYGRTIEEYTDSVAPKGYEYDDDNGTALVYDDQCRIKERLDPNGNALYAFGDTLLSENRRTQYTPAEAAEIIGDSEDNMIVMYFK